jgi:hypothetical protein
MNGKRQKNQLKTYFKHLSDSFDPGAGEGFVEMCEDLHTLIEGIVSGDGIHIKVSSINIHLRASATNFFTFVPVLVQTTGTLADTLNRSERTVASLIDAACDDVFGYDRIGPLRRARLEPATSTLMAIQCSIAIPNKALQLLNKETETERLQDLYYAIVGVANNGETVSYSTIVEVNYIEQRRNLVIR